MEAIENEEKEEKKKEEVKKKSWLPSLFGGKNNKTREQLLYELLMDSGKELEKVFNYLGVLTWSERRLWIYLWLDIVGSTKSKGIGYRHFLTFFNFGEDDFARRVFDIMNTNFTGIVTFPELVGFCARYLVVDRRLTEEFAFRMMLRRAGSYYKYSSVLDLDDIKFFFTYRYKFKNIKQRNKRALDLFQYIDTDGDGGLEVMEFHDFCKKNLSIVKFMHKIQQHLRNIVFGVKYWVQKSRRLASHHGGTLASVSLSSRMNSKSEQFTIDLSDPVVDGYGNPIATPYDILTEYYNQERGAGATSDAVASAYGKKIIHKPPIPMLFVSRLERGDFALDFPEVELERLKRLKVMEIEKEKLQKLANGLAAHTYNLMIKVCGDLVHGRRPLRMAFNKWKEVSDSRGPQNKGSAVEDEDCSPIARVESTESAAGEKKTKRSEKLEQVSKKRGMEAVIERVLPNVPTETETDIYSSIVQATEARRKEAADRSFDSYLESYLGEMQRSGLHQDRARYLASNAAHVLPLMRSQSAPHSN